MPITDFNTSLLPGRHGTYSWEGCYCCDPGPCVPQLCGYGRNQGHPGVEAPPWGSADKARSLEEFWGDSSYGDCSQSGSGVNKNCLCRPGDHWAPPTDPDVIRYRLAPALSPSPVVTLYPHSGGNFSSLPNVAATHPSWPGRGVRLSSASQLTGHIRARATDSRYEAGEYFWPVYRHDGDGFFAYDPANSALVQPPYKGPPYPSYVIDNSICGWVHQAWYMPLPCGVWLYATKRVILPCEPPYKVTYTPIEAWVQPDGTEGGHADLLRWYHNGPDFCGGNGNPVDRHCVNGVKHHMRQEWPVPDPRGPLALYVEDRGGICTRVIRLWAADGIGAACPEQCWRQHVGAWTLGECDCTMASDSVCTSGMDIVNDGFVPPRLYEELSFGHPGWCNPASWSGPAFYQHQAGPPCPDRLAQFRAGASLSPDPYVIYSCGPPGETCP